MHTFSNNPATSTKPHNSAAQLLIRWLHLSDFHVGKDNYGQRRLFRYILKHIQVRVKSGLGPDMVFITGDIANKGQLTEYQEFLDGFFFPLVDLVSSECGKCIFIVPGNHDVDRAQARAVKTYDVLLDVPEFLDPSDKGVFERRPIAPRFAAYIDADCTNNTDKHWLISPSGASIQSLDVRGHKIGVLGLNTAWLSCSDQDRHHMSPGKGILELGLEALQDCEARIVLGHHAIDWFLDTELEPTRALLGKHNALYLHGHMHKGHAGYEEGAGYPFLTLQSGACFQAREDEMWVNRLLWCELDLGARYVQVEPLQWSREHQEWSLDSSAFPERYRQPGTDRWILPLPAPSVRENKIIKGTPSTESGRPQPPSGWLWIDGQFLAERRIELTPEQALSYFDGRIPIWREALSPKIPRRVIVHELVTEMEAARQKRNLRVTLLMGAAGEGKSTVLMQTICDLVEANVDWHILWRNDPSSPLPAEFLARLPLSSGTWLIASDEADSIALRVFDAVKALSGARRGGDVQFLLSCRDTDWIGVQADQLRWHQYATFVEKRLRGLQTEDARQIVKAWSAYGRQGLGQLEGLELEEAVQRLVQAAKSEATRSSQDGAFLGAMLRVRWGEGLKAHVYDLLKRLSERPISGTMLTLLDAFAYIAAPHAENILILSKEVLASAVGCHIDEVRRKVLWPLGEEAAIATTGQYIFTRHRAIAEAGVDILAETFCVDFDRIYVDLVRAALQAHQSVFVPNYSDWRYLSSRFSEKGNLPLGIRLAEAALEVESGNPFLIVKLAQLLREAGQSEQSVRVFRETPVTTQKHRGYYHEWGTSEGINGNRALSAWLISVALANGIELKPPDNQQAKLSLNGLGIAFAELYESYNDLVFVQACGASAQLGLMLKLDPATKSFLLTNRARASGVDDVEPLEALGRLQAGVIAAWRQRESELPEWVPVGNALTFNGLARLLRIKIE